jgi:hypothetical protein
MLSSSWWKIMFLTLMGMAVCTCGRAPPTTKNTQRHINILNESGTNVEIHWIHPTTRAPTLMSTPHVMNGASFPVDSFIGHEFEVRELPSVKTGVCRSDDQTCRSAFFVVSGNQDQGAYALSSPLHIRFDGCVCVICAEI